MALEAARHVSCIEAAKSGILTLQMLERYMCDIGLKPLPIMHFDRGATVEAVSQGSCQSSCRTSIVADLFLGTNSQSHPVLFTAFAGYESCESVL